MTRLGIIVVTGLNNNINLRQSKGLAWKWLRGLAANAALDPVHKTSAHGLTHTQKQKREDIFTHTHPHIMQSFCVFPLRHMKDF